MNMKWKIRTSQSHAAIFFHARDTYFIRHRNTTGIGRTEFQWLWIWIFEWLDRTNSIFFFKMREILSLFLLCFLFSISVAQQGQGWPADKFSNVERHLENIQLYVRSLQDIVYQERMKYQPFAQNSTSGGAMNMAYTSFINDVESRLAKMEFATSELVKKMSTCPGDPQRKC